MTRSKAFLILQSLLIVLLAGWLSAMVVQIYNAGLVDRASGDALSWIFSREVLERAIAPIAPLFWAVTGMGLAGLLLGVRDMRADAPRRDAICTRDLLARGVAEPDEAIAQERARQKRLLCCGWGGFVACMLQVVVYMADMEHFPGSERLEEMFRSLVRGILPWCLLGMGFLVILGALRERSVIREIELLKARRTGRLVTAVPAKEKTGFVFLIVRVAVLLAAIAMIIAGVQNGGMRDVFIKAVNLCTECVGLG